MACLASCLTETTVCSTVPWGRCPVSNMRRVHPLLNLVRLPLDVVAVIMDTLDDQGQLEEFAEGS